MSKILDLNSVDASVRQKLYFQKYLPKKVIDGVKIFDLKNNIDDDSDFAEILRIDNQGELAILPGFKLKQINRTKFLPGSIKAWHIHLMQDELWYVLPEGTLLVGLWDVRADSKTRGVTMRLSLGGGEAKLLYVPKGVAHGSVNFTSEPVQMFYFVDETFNAEKPDEGRIPWDAQGADFWKPIRD